MFSASTLFYCVKVREKRMKRVLCIVLTSLLLLFGCTNVTSDEQTMEEIPTQPTEQAAVVTPSCGGDEPIGVDPVINLEEPPLLQIITPQQERYDVNYHSCTWEYDGMVLCADVPHPLQIKQISPLFNAEGVDYSLRLNIEPFAEDYTVTCWDIETQDTVPTILDYENNRIDLDPRLTKGCVFEVSVEYPQGTAAYCFGVEFVASTSAVIDEGDVL